MNEQLRRAMGAHARELWANIAQPHIAKLVTHGAGSGKHQLALHRITGFFHLGRELSEEFVLRLGVRVELVDHRVRLLGHLLVRMRAQTRDVAGANFFRVDLAVLDRSQQDERGFGAFQNRVEGLGAKFRLQPVQVRHQFRDSSLLIHGRDDCRLECDGSVRPG